MDDEHHYPLPPHLQTLYDEWNEAWHEVTHASIKLARALREHAVEVLDVHEEAARLLAAESSWRVLCSGMPNAVAWLEERGVSFSSLPHVHKAAQDIATWFDLVRGPCPGVGMGRIVLPKAPDQVN